MTKKIGIVEWSARLLRQRRCRVCKRLLTSYDSRRLGVGPTCGRKTTDNTSQGRLALATKRGAT